MKKMLIIVFLLLTACGGGGGGGGTAVIAPTPTPVGTPVNLTAFRGVYLGISTGSQYNFPVLFGSDTLGRAWSGSLTIVADGPITFEGQSTSRSRSLTTIQLAGTAPVSDSTSNYFLLSDGSPYKFIDNSTGVAYTPISNVPIPTSAKVGDSGAFATLSGTDGTTETITWALNPDFNGASVLVITSITKSGATVIATEVDSYFLDATGTPTKIAVSVTTSGITVVLSGNKS